MQGCLQVKVNTKSNFMNNAIDASFIKYKRLTLNIIFTLSLLSPLKHEVKVSLTFHSNLNETLMQVVLNFHKVFIQVVLNFH